MGNSGEWQGYYSYAKTTGGKTYFSVDMKFKTTENGIETFHGEGMENGDEFMFKNALITGL